MTGSTDGSHPSPDGTDHRTDHGAPHSAGTSASAPALDGAAVPGDPATIRFDRVQVERGRRTVLDVERLDIGVGSTALVGPNGSGKSTMLHVIAGLIAPTSGSVTVESTGSGPHGVAYVLQSQLASRHLLVTAREVVALARTRRFGRAGRADRLRVDEVMERLGVADLADRHLADMSGGQRQRVFIAQGLAQDAGILLLDEPVAGLDLASEQTIRQAVEAERASGRTVVVATHDLDEARRADRVVLLNGTVVAAGPPAEVLTPAFLRRAYRGRVLDLGDGSVAVDDDHHH